MELAVTLELLQSIYNDMKAREELGLVSFDDVENYSLQLWEAVAEKVPEEYHPSTIGEVNLFGAIFGTISEKLIREHRTQEGKEWW